MDRLDIYIDAQEKYFMMIENRLERIETKLDKLQHFKAKVTGVVVGIGFLLEILKHLLPK